MEESLDGKGLFHVALAAGVIPLLGLPFAALAAFTARRDPRWGKRTLALLVIDLVVALVIGASAMGALPIEESLGASIAEPAPEPVNRCEPADAEGPSTSALVTGAVVIGSLLVLAVIGRRRGVPGARAWLPLIAVPPIAGLAGLGARIAACELLPTPLPLETSLIASELALIVLGASAVALQRGTEIPPLDDGGMLSIPRTVGLGLFYVLAWVPRVSFLALPLFALARALGVGDGSEEIAGVLSGDRTPLALAMTFVAAAMLAPIAEELLFRGVLVPHLARFLRPWTAIAVGALIFGMLHQAHGLARVGPMAIGAILGWARLRSGTLRAPMMIHAIVNGTALAISWLASP